MSVSRIPQRERFPRLSQTAEENVRSFVFTLAFLISVVPLGVADAKPPTANGMNEAQLTNDGQSRALTAKLQILLDRARFSPGVIDGRMGENVKKALAAYRKEQGIAGGEKEIDDETWSKLVQQAPDKVIVPYRITEEDVSGPFTENIPEQFEEKKSLEKLAYTGPAELLAEKFHMDEDFLKELNSDTDFKKPGAMIMVANVNQGKRGDTPTVKRIVVDKILKQVRAHADDDKLVAVYPATIGSEERPAPSGTYEVRAVAKDPTYTYNPQLKFEGVDADEAFTIAPGPNNPVGSVWIDLSKESYGIHGTPEPEKIGKTSSHGCIRLTNWDVESLAKMVSSGAKVEFVGTF